MSKYLAGLSLGLVALLTGSIFLLNRSESAVFASDPNCGSPIMISGAGSGGVAIVTDDVWLDMNAPGAQKVTYLIDGEILGAARSNPGSGQWYMNWNTAFAEEGQADISARITYSQTNICETLPVEVDVVNSPEIELDAFADIEDWYGLVNSSETFHILYDLSGFGDPNLVAEFAHIKWTVQGAGSIEPRADSRARFFSGPNEADGEVQAIVSYSGQEIVIDIDTEVFADPTATNTTTTLEEIIFEDDSNDNESNDPANDQSTEIDPDDPLGIGGEGPAAGSENSQTPAEPSETIQKIFRTQNRVNACVVERLGSDDFDQLVADNRRPTYQEFEEYLECYSEANNVIPSILAPVDPVEVSTRPQSEVVTIGGIRNEQRTVEGQENEQTVLVLSGVATPNSTVLIYVFSEPLVLSTTADDQGNWSYSLEDPLAEGEHEVYALVDKGDGEYERSPVASFFIGTAEASEENPDGLSLDLIAEPTIEASNRSVNLYVAATIVTVVFVGAVLSVYFAYHKKHLVYDIPQTPVTDTASAPPAKQESDIKDFNSSR